MTGEAISALLWIVSGLPTIRSVLEWQIRV